MKNRSEVGQAGKPRSGCSQNLAGRGQILTILQGNSRSIAQKSGEICTGQVNLQPIFFKSDRLLDEAVVKIKKPPETTAVFYLATYKKVQGNTFNNPQHALIQTGCGNMPHIHRIVCGYTRVG